MTEFPAVPEPVVKTQTQVASAFSVGTGAVQRWKKDGCPWLVESPYNLQKIRDWLDARPDHGAKGGRPQLASSAAAPHRATNEENRATKLRWDAEKAKLDAGIKSVQLKILRESHFARELVETMFAERVSMTRQCFEILPESASHDIVELVRGGKINRIDAVDVIRRHVEEALEVMSADDFVELLEQRRQRASAGVAVGRGRGRPRKAKA